MSVPVSRVEIWQGGAKLYTWDDVATQIHVKEILNGIGTFSLTVPVKPADSYLYSDVALNDTAKIFLDWDTIPATPLTVGKICKIIGSDAGGYSRTFEGKNQGEVLERRLKDDYFFAVNASDITAELANDLGIYSVGDTDATVAKNETVAFDAEPYLAALKKVSDYYVDATNVKKDFYVDVDNHFNWKARPIRTTGVETLTVGENLAVCSVYRDVLPVKNNIIVYGRKNRPEPTTWDACEATTNWTKEDGFSHGTDAADFKVGTVSYTAQSPLEATPRVIVYYSPPNPIYGGSLRNGFDSIHFWVKVTGAGAAPDLLRDLRLTTSVADSHWFNRDLADPWGRSTYVFGEWNEYDFTIGPGYAANGWTAWGSNDNDWNDNIERVRFDFASSGNGTMVVRIDGLYFHSQRWYCATQSDAPSIASYGQRDLIYIDDRCVSDAEALARAKVLLYLLKTPPVRLDMTTKGNTNIKIGDRIPMTIPAENITATNFDVLTVETDLIKDLGFTTKASLIEASDMRQLPVMTTQEGFLRKFEAMNELGRGFVIHK